MTSRAPSVIHRHPVVVCFALAYAFSWAIWGTSLAQQHGSLGFHVPGMLAYLGVSLAAVATVAGSSGRTGVRELLSRMIRWRVGVRWYAVALLVPIALPLLASALYHLAGGDVPVGAKLPLGAALGYFVMNTPFMLITEEAAWRGVALPRLQARRSALSASLIVGLLWGVWHTPLFLDANAPQEQWPYLSFVLFATATSVLATWIYNNTGGSLLLAALFHAATDAALAFSGILYGDAQLFRLGVAVAVGAAILVVLLAGPQRLVRGRPDARGSSELEQLAIEGSVGSVSGWT